ALLFALVFMIFYYFIDLGTNSNTTIYTLKRENNELKKEIERITSSYKNLVTEMDSISILNKELRTVANLEPISDEERLAGTGGSEEFLLSGLNIKDIETKKMLSYVDDMIKLVDFEKSQAKEIANKIKINRELYSCLPAMKPTVGHYSINGFGMRIHPILGIRKFHSGLDINCDYGTPVHAPGIGKVVAVERQSGFGLVVEIDHGFGYLTIYAHLSKALVKRGDSVTRGQVIAKSGNSGLSSGPHLHYEVHHDGKALNPIDFFFDEYTFLDLDTSTISLSEK
ncbi:MAG: M23 family metallopeptidase, partial [Ignavibacteriaceae bacterium]|nr:M23 family metallopeptidase [Ignavibacteriaceae bacterium]